MDDDDSYLYGDSTEDVKPAAVQTTGESRTREALSSFLYFHSMSAMEILMIPPTGVILSATTVSRSLSMLAQVQALSCALHPGRISLETTRSVSQGLVAKLEEQAADAAADEDGEEEQPAENGGDEEDDDDDDSDEVHAHPCSFSGWTY